ncbi:uncharacterized protein Dvar_13030 [Desulfosarcina variabilis str. Montpellier]
MSLRGVYGVLSTGTDSKYAPADAPCLILLWLANANPAQSGLIIFYLHPKGSIRSILAYERKSKMV